MAKFECQRAARPAELERQLNDAITAAGLKLTDSASYNIGGTAAYLQVWGEISILILGEGGVTTVTAISPDPKSAALIEKILEK